MLSHRVVEMNNDSVDIIDLDEETVKGMLHFIYSGVVPDLNQIAHKLLAAADKYELGRLKLMCERALCLSLTASNVCEILVHADLHSAEQLKTRCISYINVHSAEVMDTEGWKILASDYGPLLAQVYKAATTQQIPATVSLSPPRKRNRH
jgi:speckle-type POZ protein